MYTTSEAHSPAQTCTWKISIDSTSWHADSNVPKYWILMTNNGALRKHWPRTCCEASPRVQLNAQHRRSRGERLERRRPSAIVGAAAPQLAGARCLANQSLACKNTFKDTIKDETLASQT